MAVDWRSEEFRLALFSKIKLDPATFAKPAGCRCFHKLCLCNTNECYHAQFMLRFNKEYHDLKDELQPTKPELVARLSKKTKLSHGQCRSLLAVAYSACISWLVPGTNLVYAPCSRHQKLPLLDPISDCLQGLGLG